MAGHGLYEYEEDNDYEEEGDEAATESAADLVARRRLPDKSRRGNKTASACPGCGKVLVWQGIHAKRCKESASAKGLTGTTQAWADFERRLMPPNNYDGREEVQAAGAEGTLNQQMLGGEGREQWEALPLRLWLLGKEGEVEEEGGEEDVILQAEHVASASIFRREPQAPDGG